ncbi:hypothetical protein R83H12_02035 [Fibrobacteria bacterium R8-3-H12]
MENPWKNIDISNIKPSVFPRKGLLIGEYEPMLSDKRIPALFPIGETNGICFLQTAGNKDIVYKTMQSFVLRLLLQINPGLVKLTLYDGIGIGTNLIGLSHIDKKIKGENILTKKDELKRALEAIESDIGTTIQKVLGPKYADKSLIDYNEAAGKQAKPYHFIALADFPKDLGKEHLDLVFKIVQSGRRAGKFVILGLNTEWQPENSYEKIDIMPLLDTMGVVYEAGGRWYVKNIREAEYINERFNLRLSNYFPDSDTLEKIQEHISSALKKAEKVEVEINISDDDLWKETSSDGIEVPIGQLNITDKQYFSLSVEDGSIDVPHHCLVGGATGSGKTVLLHNIICNAARLYSPDEVQFILLDYKEGTEFKIYEKLPHAKVLSINSEREYGVSVLKYVNDEIERRGKLFKDAGGGAAIAKYRAKTGKKMPRILIIIDEFQKLLDGDTKTADLVSGYFDDIGRRGRSFGMHLILSSQSLSGIDINKTLSHLGLRIALKLNTEKDCVSFLGHENYVPFKDLQKKGEAVYNAKAGLTEGNIRFQVAYLSDTEIAKIISSIGKKEYEPFHHFLYDGSVVAKIESNKDIPKEYKPNVKKCDVYIGEPVALEEKHSFYVLRRQNESNVLLVGQDIQSAMSILYHSIEQIVPQSSEGSQVYVCNKVNMDNEYCEALAPLSEKFDCVKIIDNDIQIQKAIEDVYDEVEKRKENFDSNSGRIILAFADIYNARNLRKKGYDDSPLAEKLTAILKDGPGFGIHCIVHSSSYDNLKKVLDAMEALNEFEVKIELRGGEGYKIFGDNGDEKSSPRNLSIANIQTPQSEDVAKTKVYSL